MQRLVDLQLFEVSSRVHGPRGDFLLRREQHRSVVTVRPCLRLVRHPLDHRLLCPAAFRLTRSGGRAAGLATFLLVLSSYRVLIRERFLRPGRAFFLSLTGVLGRLAGEAVVLRSLRAGPSLLLHRHDSARNAWDGRLDARLPARKSELVLELACAGFILAVEQLQVPD